jgi:phage baseplate assembly protein V
MAGPVATETRQRVNMSVARGLVALADDGKKMQRVQLRLLSDETKDNVEHFQPYGFTSVPLQGAEAVCVFVGGGRDHGLVVCVDDRRYRLKNLEGGEVALYTDEGTSVVLRRGKIVEVTCKEYRLTCEKLTIEASDSITVTSPSVDVNP